MLWQQGWVWIALGILMGLAEMVLPGFYLLGFAIGAVLTGILVWLGLLTGLPAILVSLAVMAVLSWLLLRRLAGVRHGQKKIWHSDINDN